MNINIKDQTKKNIKNNNFLRLLIKKELLNKYDVISSGIISFHRPKEDDGWSDDNDTMIEESSKNHFIDIASRKYCLESLKPILEKKHSMYCDFGCSSGWLIEEVEEKFSEIKIIGSDYYDVGPVKLERRRPAINLFQFDMCSIPFKTNSLDAFSCLNVLEHIEKDDCALKELKRVLRPGGLGFIMVPASPSLYDYYDEVHLHFRRYSKNEFKEKIKNAGFEIKQINYMATCLYLPFYAVKKLNNRKMKNKTLVEKRKIVEAEIKETQKSMLSSLIVKFLMVERLFGKFVPYPFGIRLIAVVSAT